MNARSRTTGSSCCTLAKTIPERQAEGRAIDQETSDWQEYRNEHGFSLGHPKNYRVTEGAGDADERAPGLRQVPIVEVDENGRQVTGPPKIIIKVIPPFSITFTLCEGIVWEHFEAVMHSFRFDPDASASAGGPPSQENQ